MDDAHLRHVVSADGTEIGYWQSGHGPPLLLVHGSLGDHSRWDQLIPHLTADAAVHAMDRRGRGASGDAIEYDLAREHEDVAAVVDDIAERSAQPVDVYGSSYGGICAFGAVALTSNLRRLALYEGWPPIDPASLAAPAGVAEQMEQFLDDGQREAALELAYRELVGVTEDELTEVREQPNWSARVAAVHTIIREERAFQQAVFDDRQAAEVSVPVLLLTGSESPVWRPQADVVKAALPDSRIAVLEGQGHVADVFAPDLVAAPLLAFLQT